MTKTQLELNILELSLNSIKNFNQAFIDELQGTYIALMYGNARSSYSISGVEFTKVWLELKSLHASHTILGAAFQDVRNLQ